MSARQLPVMAAVDATPALPAWPSTEEEARAEQDRLRPLVEHADHSPVPGTDGTVVAGVDVAYDDERDLVAAAAVALDAASLEVVAQATVLAPVSFPYVPGLLAFREVPAVLGALDGLGLRPGLVVCDGYGVAHPRRFGLASHLGVLTGLPTIGVAKTPFLFRHPPVGERRGDSAPLLAPGEGGGGEEEVGRALRTRAGVKPVFVSVGHRTDLDAACAHTLWLARRYRLPETTRRADTLCRAALRDAQRRTGATTGATTGAAMDTATE